MTRPGQVESYEQAIEYLFSRINYERVANYSAGDFKLDRMRELLSRLGDPHRQIPAVHIAGTKGKGSTAAMLASVLKSAGYCVGLFTSPHISAFEERIAVGGQLVSPDELVELVNLVAEHVAELDKTPGRVSPTYFEIATAMAWLHFRRQGVEIAVLEVGLGGRLDATNLCSPEVTVITTISRDHTRQLGSRLEQIAREKAGIIKPGVPLVSGVAEGEAEAAIEAICREQNAPIDRIGRDFTAAYHAAEAGRGPLSATVDVFTSHRAWCGLPVPLLGEHQSHNTALAVAAIERLQQRSWAISEEAVRHGLSHVQWPGRIEVLRLRPTVIVDAAHNWASVSALLKTIDAGFASRRRTLLFAATRDKDVAGMLRQLLPRFDNVILTSYQNNPRGVPVEELHRMATSMTDAPLHSASDTLSAWKLARRMSQEDDLICVTGSFFIAAELRELILDDRRATAEHPLESRR